jgi:TM2 domain-containing membrane protein YozV
MHAMRAMVRIFMFSLGRIIQSRIIPFLKLGIEILSLGSAELDRVDCSLYCGPQRYEKGDHSMRGKILNYSIQSGQGVISGKDGTRYTFDGADWCEDSAPDRGISVDFDVDGKRAIDVYRDGASAGGQTGSKDKTAAGLLAIFLGFWGIHKFYLGFTGAGLVYLLINTIGWVVTIFLLGLPNFVLGIIAFIEGVIYLTKSDEEFHQRYVVEKKQWF